jgi:hypothetical protein
MNLANRFAGAMLLTMLAGCASDLLPTQSNPWIQAKWLDTHSESLASDELGKIAITSGGYLFGNSIAVANFIPDKTNFSDFSKVLALDEFGTGTTGLTVNSSNCTANVGKVLDSVTIKLDIQGVTKATVRLALVCQSGIRP